jgi:hypothetical protein
VLQLQAHVEAGEVAGGAVPEVQEPALALAAATETRTPAKGARRFRNARTAIGGGDERKEAMTAWDVLQVGGIVIASLGGWAVIVLGLAGFIGRIWADRLQGRLQGDIDAKLRRLDSRLTHGNFVLQRLAEAEMEGITACWRLASKLLPLINGVRPPNSSKDVAALMGRANDLSEGHDKLLDELSEHEPFLPAAIRDTLNVMTRIARVELTMVSTDKPFETPQWWKDGKQNRDEMGAMHGQLLTQVKERLLELRAAQAAEQGDK